MRQIVAHILSLPYLSSMTFWVVLSSFFFSSCSADKSYTLAVDELISVRGQVDLSTESADNLEFYIVTKDGVRQAADDYQLENDGSFSLRFTEDQLTQSFDSSLSTRLLLMNREFSEPLDEGQLSDRIAGYLRLEIIGKPAIEATELKYSQQFIPVTAKDLLKAKPAIRLGDTTINLQTVGRRKISVQSDSGDPLVGATVTAIPFTSEATINPTQFLGLMPVVTTTDEQAEAWVYPLPTEGINPQYQIAAWHDGFFSFVSREMTRVDNEPVYDVSLQVLGEFGQQWGDGDYIGFASSYKTQILEDASGQSTYVGYVNAEEIAINILRNDTDFSGYKISVFAGEELIGTPTYESIHYTFSSEQTVFVPRTFEDGATENGNFLILIEDLAGSGDQRRPIKGIKSTVTPLVDDTAIGVQSSVGVDGIISGVVGSSFKLSYSSCPVLGEIGLLQPESESGPAQILFTSCDSGDGLVRSTDSLTGGVISGGYYELSFYVKDRFGNISGIQGEGANSRSVYLDFGIPNLAEQSLTFGFHFGVADKDSAPGSDESPFNFGLGTIITPETIDQYVVRFASESLCRHGNPSDADGFGFANNLGHHLYGFRLGKNAEDSQTNTAVGYKTCLEDQALSTETVIFPNSTSEMAQIFLQVTDKAGHVSPVQSYSIPFCDGRAGDFVVCWEP